MTECCRVGSSASLPPSSSAQSRTDRPVVPVVEELTSGDRIGLIPEPAEVVLDAPGSTRSKLLFLKSIQFLLTFFVELLGIEQEVIPLTLRRSSPSFISSRCSSRRTLSTLR